MEHSLDEFLESQNISNEEWLEAKADWNLLCDIANDHKSRSEDLRATANYFAAAFQATKGVHSVRWRIKDPDHLIAKIIRKRIEKSPKYQDISIENYHQIITDLIGVRVLHLFKHEYEGIDEAIRAKWNLHETPPIHYIRMGDTTPENFKKNLFEEKPHPAGYRSIHYVLKTQPTIREYLVEVQVRTIFEEGWSEIDHKIRYPNFSDNPLVTYFLTIFNRMAGSADEMGTFVKDLSTAMSINDLQVSQLTDERDQTLRKMSLLVNELSQAKDVGASYKETIAKLKKDIDRLEKNSNKEAVSKSSQWVLGIDNTLLKEYEKILRAASQSGNFSNSDRHSNLTKEAQQQSTLKDLRLALEKFKNPVHSKISTIKKEDDKG
ncbi:RelA/SpoT domain-containing protein [Pseudomonas monteilii]